jgi:hypothetical protein
MQNQVLYIIIYKTTGLILSVNSLCAKKTDEKAVSYGIKMHVEYIQGNVSKVMSLKQYI